MSYRRFEMLALGVGAISIGATIFMSLLPAPDYIEIAAQLLLFGVLVAAVDRGLAAGAAAALGATLAYILLRLPTITAGGMTATVLQLIGVRTIAYGVVGILGGELCARVKYVLARLHDGRSVDAESRVYSQHVVQRLIQANLSGHARYGSDFSVVLLEVTPSAKSGLGERRATGLVRAIADHLRNDIRIVDDVGRLDDGRFVVVLPQTPRSGGEVAAERIVAGVRGLLGTSHDDARAAVMSAGEDLDALRAFVDDIAPPPTPSVSADV